MVKKRIKKIVIILFIVLFLSYLFLNIFVLTSKNKIDFHRSTINTNNLDESIIVEEPYYQEEYFIKIFLNEYLRDLKLQGYPVNENVYLDFYFNQSEIYVKINFFDTTNYIYHYYLM